MATTGADAIFLDTNVLVYANVAESPQHVAALAAIETRYLAGVELWVSRQVLREFLAVLSRSQTFTQPKPMGTLIERVRFFQSRFRVAEDGPAVTEKLLDLVAHIPASGKQVHDANIVATMLAYGIPNLLTHNTADFVRFASLITVLPFTS